MATRPPPIARLAIAGIIAPVWFITLVIIQGIRQPDYSHIAMPISALAAWPAGWLQNLNFFVSAALLAAFAIGVHGVIRPARFGLTGIGLLLVGSVGVCMMVIARKALLNPSQAGRGDWRTPVSVGRTLRHQR